MAWVTHNYGQSRNRIRAWLHFPCPSRVVEGGLTLRLVLNWSGASQAVSLVLLWFE